jgi:hypothetical protein
MRFFSRAFRHGSCNQSWWWGRRSSMNSTAPCSERRHHHRLSIHAAAFVLKNGKYHGSYGIENISAGGVKLVGRVPIHMEESVEVLLQLSGYPSRRIRARGVYCRGPDPHEYIIGLVFEVPDPGVARDLENMVSELERKQNTT